MHCKLSYRLARGLSLGLTIIILITTILAGTYIMSRLGLVSGLVLTRYLSKAFVYTVIGVTGVILVNIVLDELDK